MGPNTLARWLVRCVTEVAGPPREGGYYADARIWACKILAEMGSSNRNQQETTMSEHDQMTDQEKADRIRNLVGDPNVPPVAGDWKEAQDIAHQGWKAHESDPDRFIATFWETIRDHIGYRKDVNRANGYRRALAVLNDWLPPATSLTVDTESGSETVTIPEGHVAEVAVKEKAPTPEDTPDHVIAIGSDATAIGSVCTCPFGEPTGDTPDTDDAEPMVDATSGATAMAIGGMPHNVLLARAVKAERERDAARASASLKDSSIKLLRLEFEMIDTVLSDLNIPAEHGGKTLGTCQRVNLLAQQMHEAGHDRDAARADAKVAWNQYEESLATGTDAIAECDAYRAMFKDCWTGEGDVPEDFAPSLLSAKIRLAPSESLAEIHVGKSVYAISAQSLRAAIVRPPAGDADIGSGDVFPALGTPYRTTEAVHPRAARDAAKLARTCGEDPTP